MYIFGIWQWFTELFKVLNPFLCCYLKAKSRHQTNRQSALKPIFYSLWLKPNDIRFCGRRIDKP